MSTDSIISKVWSFGATLREYGELVQDSVIRRFQTTTADGESLP